MGGSILDSAGQQETLMMRHNHTSLSRRLSQDLHAQKQGEPRNPLYNRPTFRTQFKKWVTSESGDYIEF